MEAYASWSALASGFDDDGNWSDDSESSAVSAAGAKEQEQLSQCTSKSTEMELVSPLVRSIFENRKNASQNPASSRAPLAPTLQNIKHGPQREFEEMLQKKVQALDEEVATFKKETRRLKNLSKEHTDGLTKLAREKAEWEEHKKSQMLTFQAQQEEQMEKLKKEKQMLDHRSAAINSLPATQRKDLEELKETLAKQQEEHRGKELRLRLTIKRLRGLNEDLTRQVLEMQDELRRYETCLLSALDDRENTRVGGDSHRRQQAAVPLDGRTRSVLKATSMKENSCSSSLESHSRSESSDATPRLLAEQAKTLSNLFT